MKTLMISLLVLLLSALAGGCEAVTQDDFSVAVETDTKLDTPEFGRLELVLYFQDGAQPETVSPETLLRTIYYTMRAYQDRFGTAPTNLRTFTMVVIRSTSSQWNALCEDAPNDSYHVDACSWWALFPYRSVEVADWYIAENNDNYNRGTNNLGTIVHETLHGLLFQNHHHDGTESGDQLNADGDGSHSTPDIWENDPDSVYWAAMAYVRDAGLGTN